MISSLRNPRMGRRMDEQIVEIIEDESKGAPSMTGVSVVRIGSDKAQYDLFFTNRRIIAAAVFSQSDLSDFMPAAGFESMFKWKKTRKERRNNFKGKNPDELLNLHKDNYEIPYENVKSIKIKKGVIGAKLIADVIWQGNIQTLNLKIPKKKVENIQSLLNTYLSTKVVQK